MRLLIVSNLFEPDHAGGAAIYSDFAHAMAERGHQVTVRCAYPYFPEWRDKSGANGWRIRTERTDGVLVERFGLVLPSRPQRLTGRLLFEGSHLASLLRSIRRGMFDAVLVFATHPSSTGFGAVVSRARRLPLWINVQDLASDAAHATGLSGRKTVAAALQGLDRLMLRQADVLSGLSPGMVDRLRALCPKADVRWVPNWLHRSMAAHVARTEPLPRAVPAGDPLRLLYAGNLGGKQELLRVCQSLASSNAAFDFEIHAAGSAVGSLRDWVARTNDRRFRLEPILPEHEFVRALRRAHLFVISETPGSGHSYMPSKLLPALATGTPVLAVSDVDSSLGIEVRQHGLGIAIDWPSVSSTPGLLEDMLTSDDPLTKWSENAVARARAFDREAVVDRFASGLEDLAQRNATRPAP